MRITESTQQMKRAKERLTTLMRVYKISRREVTKKSEYHYITVCNALDVNKPYWNQDIINLVEQMIEGKKITASMTASECSK
jgi:hypothetical protein